MAQYRRSGPWRKALNRHLPSREEWLVYRRLSLDVLLVIGAFILLGLLFLVADALMH